MRCDDVQLQKQQREARDPEYQKAQAEQKARLQKDAQIEQDRQQQQQVYNLLMTELSPLCLCHEVDKVQCILATHA